MQEMQVWSLGQEDPLEKGMATCSEFLPGKSYGQRSLAGYSSQGHKRVRHERILHDFATRPNNNNHNSCHRLGGLSYRHLFLIVLGAGKSKSKVLADSVLGEGCCYSFTDGHLCIVSSWDKKQREKLSHVFSYKGTNSIIKAALSWPRYLPKSSFPNTITLEIRVSIWILGIISMQSVTAYQSFDILTTEFILYNAACSFIFGHVILFLFKNI